MSIADHEFSPDVAVHLDGKTLLTLVPGREDGAKQASVHLAKQAQRKEREDVIAARLESEGMNLLSQQSVDACAAGRVAKVLPMDLSAQERHDAGAVAVRLHDPRWQLVSRFYAADAILVELRKSQRLHGWYLADSDLRQLADHLAAVSYLARFKVWTGQTIVTALEWCKAALGILTLTEDQ